MTATILFHGDRSVGISSYYYTAEIPEFEPEYREETRELLKKLYTELDGEFYPSVYFEDETID